MESQNQRSRRAVSRRTLARGAAWSVPILVSAAAVPAYAISAGCFTQVWSASNVSGAYGSRLMTTSVTKTSGNAETMTVTVRQNRSAGVGCYYDPLDNVLLKETAPSAKGTSDFAAAMAGNQVAATSIGTAPKASQNNSYTVPAGSTSTVLTLNQGTNSGTTPASETLTWTFTDSAGKAAVPKSVTFNVYDVTRISGANPDSQNYTDLVTFGGATMAVTSQTGPTSATAGSNSLTGTVGSGSGGGYATVVLTGFSTNGFTLTYRNAGTASNTNASGSAPLNAQYLGLGDLTICF